MLTATGRCVSVAAAEQVWSALTAAVILAAGWSALVWVAAGYDANPKPVRRWSGRVLLGAAAVCGLGCLIARAHLRVDNCGNPVGAAASWEGWLFLAGLAAVAAGVVLTHPGSGWIAPAAVVVGEAGIIVVVLGLPASALRTEALLLLIVHGSCTTVATWWARQLRASPPPLQAKAAEASRVLAGSWLILILLLSAGGRRVDQLLPESGLVALFVATGISLVLGTGYTRYIETRHGNGPAWEQPEADRLTRCRQEVSAAASRGSAWLVRYHEHW